MTYTTTQGDTWDGMAYRLLGQERYAVRLMDANLQYLDTVIFGPGVVLTVPNIPADQSDDLPPWKREADV